MLSCTLICQDGIEGKGAAQSQEGCLRAVERFPRGSCRVYGPPVGFGGVCIPSAAREDTGGDFPPALSDGGQEVFFLPRDGHHSTSPVHFLLGESALGRILGPVGERLSVGWFRLHDGWHEA